MMEHASLFGQSTDQPYTAFDDPANVVKVAGTPILGHFLCSISLYLQNYAVVGIYKINFDCSENNLH